MLPGTGAAWHSHPIGNDGSEDLWDRLRTHISVFVRTELEILVLVSVEEYLADRRPQIMEQQESDIVCTVTRGVVTRLKPSVNLVGIPHGRAQPPLPGDPNDL